MIKIIINIFFLLFATVAFSSVIYKQAPIQQQLELDQKNTCEQDLGYYKKKLKEHPNNPYYKFKTYKLKNRCVKYTDTPDIDR